MKPHSENSPPLTGGERLGLELRNARHNNVSTTSSKSDPFASTDTGDDIQLEDFSCIEAQMPRSGSPSPSKLVSERPHRLVSDPRNLLTVHKRSASLNNDKAVSDWETVVPDDEFGDRPQVPAQPLRRRKNFDFIFHTQEIIDSRTKQQNSQAKYGKHTTLAPPRALPKLSTRHSPKLTSRLHSFHSTSSFYSDLDEASESSQKTEKPVLDTQNRQPFQWSPTPRPDIMRSASKTSTSTNDDPFKYDRDPYSGFLQASEDKEGNNAEPSAKAHSQSNERLPPNAPANNVAEEIKVPVIRGTKKELSPEPGPSRRRPGGIAALLRPRPETDPDADWQTVITEPHFDSMQQEFHDSIGKGTGSSLADVSDVTELEYGSTDRIVQHPHMGAMPRSYLLRNERQRNMPVLVPRIGSPDGIGFPQNATRKFPQTPARTPGGMSRFSNPFRRDGSMQRPDRESILLNMESRRDSYQTLDSDNNPPDEHLTENDNPSNTSNTRRFRWSRIRENLGRDLPKTPLTIFDQPLYRFRLKEASESKQSPHVPHDEFLATIPRLHFPLISLPEAALLQHFRRERGDEDHTNPGISFVSRDRSNTVTTIESSMLPQTPSPIGLHFSTGSPGNSIARPAPVHRTHRINETLRRRNSSERIADMLVSSSAILHTPPPTEPRTPTNSNWYRGRNRDPAPIFCEGLPRARGFSSSTLERRARMRDSYLPNEGSLFTPSEVDVIESTREEIISRRQFSGANNKGEKMIFVGITVLTLFFPFIGILALWGKFDPAISWYTHGEVHSLAKSQRYVLKRQLLAEAVAYMGLITFLAVFFSVGV
ncbi:hypothetical protein EDB81DRAFT_944708 [Dactylonectria macrodidyma]|uniref:Uncharacterized protein n=1 Tax=Dactylonectria macrodidyma TaxID=307937 RepID=A0A9P9F8N4_9HYPO|nr:hypothetical protein EDB81DRAFT_944708 [Dactylonectria macrodidyma]